MSRHEQKIKNGARRFLEDGEEVLAAFVARPRGWTQSMAGGAGPGWVGATIELEANAAANAKGVTTAVERGKLGAVSAVPAS